MMLSISIVSVCLSVFWTDNAPKAAEPPPPPAAPTGDTPASPPPAKDPPRVGPTSADPPAIAGDAPDPDALPAIPPARSDAGLPVVRQTIRFEQFDLEVASTTDSIAKGLSGRDRVPLHHGMLFVMPYAYQLGYWMIDCRVPIDIAFVDERGVVTATHTMKVEPRKRADESQAEYEGRLPRYSSGEKARYAIELMEGEFARLGIAKGSALEWDWRAISTIARAERLAGSKPKPPAQP